jgi:signal transduction histidine kinase
MVIRLAESSHTFNVIIMEFVVEKHGGQLQCLSVAGEGTEFIIKILLQLDS